MVMVAMLVGLVAAVVSMVAHLTLKLADQLAHNLKLAELLIIGKEVAAAADGVVEAPSIGRLEGLVEAVVVIGEEVVAIVVNGEVGLQLKMPTN